MTHTSWAAWKEQNFELLEAARMRRIAAQRVYEAHRRQVEQRMKPLHARNHRAARLLRVLRAELAGRQPNSRDLVALARQR